MSNVHVKNALLCDNVIHDVQNKHSAIGIYSGDVVANSLPSQLLFAIYAEIFLEKSVDTVALKFIFNGVELLSGDLSLAGAPIGKVCVLGQSGIKLDIIEPGLLEISITADGFDTPVLQKQITIRQGSNAESEMVNDGD